MCRDPSRYNGPQHRMVEVVAGDVTRPEDMKRVMWNTEAAIFAASGKGYWSSYPVDARGALNAANACKASFCYPPRCQVSESSMPCPSRRDNVFSVFPSPHTSPKTTACAQTEVMLVHPPRHAPPALRPARNSLHPARHRRMKAPGWSSSPRRSSPTRTSSTPSASSSTRSAGG